MDPILEKHPTPWRFEKSPKGWGWGNSSVIFDANDKCVLHTRVDLKLYEFLTNTVNKEQE